MSDNEAQTDGIEAGINEEDKLFNTTLKVQVQRVLSVPSVIVVMVGLIFETLWTWTQC